MPIILLVLATASGVALAASPPAPGYRHATNQACAARTAAEARAEPDDVADRAQVLRFFRELAGAQRTLVSRLEPLRPPRADRPAFGRLVSAERDVTPLLDEAVRLLVKGATPARAQARVAGRLAKVGGRIDAEARALRVRA